MALMKHERREGMPTGIIDRLFDDRWPLRPLLLWPEDRTSVRVEEFRKNGTLVVRAELAGLDPEKDVDVSVHGDTLHIEAERHEEETEEERDYLRREFRYGAFVRDLTLPKGVTAKDVKANYHNGILEVEVPVPPETPMQKVHVTTT